jgi:hypothetical protein
MSTASEILVNAADLIDTRAIERDVMDCSGERSMSRCIDAFNAMTGHDLSEEDGWQFMVFLKFSRMQAGNFKTDDYEDAVAYTALQAEAAIKSHDWDEIIKRDDDKLHQPPEIGALTGNELPQGVVERCVTTEEIARLGDQLPESIDPTEALIYKKDGSVVPTFPVHVPAS